MIYQSDKSYERAFDGDFYTVFSDAGFKQQPREALRIKDMIIWYEQKRREENDKLKDMFKPICLGIPVGKGFNNG